MLIGAARNYNTGTCSLMLEDLIQRRRVSGKKIMKFWAETKNSSK
jgi:hypothetical protein